MFYHYNFKKATKSKYKIKALYKDARSLLFNLNSAYIRKIISINENFYINLNKFRFWNEFSDGGMNINAEVYIELFKNMSFYKTNYIDRESCSTDGYSTYFDKIERSGPSEYVRKMKFENCCLLRSSMDLYVDYSNEGELYANNSFFETYDKLRLFSKDSDNVKSRIYDFMYNNFKTKHFRKFYYLLIDTKTIIDENMKKVFPIELCE